NHSGRQEGASQANHPYGLYGAHAGNDANSKQPKQKSESDGGHDGQANAARIGVRRLSRILVGEVFSARNNRHAKQYKRHANRARGRKVISTEPGKSQRQGGITRGERSNHGHLPEFKGAIQGKGGNGAKKAGEQAREQSTPHGR